MLSLPKYGFEANTKKVLGCRSGDASAEDETSCGERGEGGDAASALHHGVLSKERSRLRSPVTEVITCALGANAPKLARAFASVQGPT